MIRRHKFVPRYFGPLRVEGIAGTVVYCYDLSTGKSKKINMERCLPADALNENDSPNLMKAYPEISFGLVGEEGEALLNNDINAHSVSSPHINTGKNVNKAGAATVRSEREALPITNRTSAATSRESRSVEENDRLKPEERRTRRGAPSQSQTRLAVKLPQNSMFNACPPGPSRVTCQNPSHGVTRSSDHRHVYAARASRSNKRYNLRSRY